MNGGFVSTGAAGLGAVLGAADACAVPYGAAPVAPVAVPEVTLAAAAVDGFDPGAFSAVADGVDLGCLGAAGNGAVDFAGLGGAAAEAMSDAVEIGRASCRERV